MHSDSAMKLLVGVYAQHTDEGVYLLAWDGISLTTVNTLSGIENPSFVCYSTAHKLVYVVSENQGPKSEVWVLQLGPAGNELRRVQRTFFEGVGSCHVEVYQHWLFVANYESGTLSILTLEEGLPNGFFQSYTYQGNGPDAERQQSSHVHASLVVEGTLLVANLGTDRVYSYSLKEKVAETAGAVWKLQAGSGPRQLAYHQKYGLLYVLTELSAEVFVCKLDDLSAGWVAQVSLVAHREGKPGGGALVASSDGQYLYASNRGDFNEITVFKCKENGQLTCLQRIGCGGIGPRSMDISPDGRWLMVANENSGNLSIFSIHQNTGKLTASPHHLAIPGASCVQFIEHEE